MNQNFPFKLLQEKLLAKKISCTEIVQDCLRQIHKHKNLNAFLEVFENEAIDIASQIDEKIKDNTQGKLAGLVVGIKDNLSYKNHSLSAGSKILEKFSVPYTSTAIQALIEEDAIIIGRQNCDEFGMGSSNENSAYGPVYNGKNTGYVSGGSSGGSAVAVQNQMCHVSIGSDTGGSIRQPASFCGTIGLKPSYSRISRYGLIAYASSFDCIGIIGNDIYLIALCLELMAGNDINDSTCSVKDVPNYSNHLKFNQKAKIAIFNQTLNSDAINEEVKDKTLKLIMKLSKIHQVDYIDFSLSDYLLPTYYILTTAEASSNLARYEGIRYGLRSDSKEIQQTYIKSRMDGFGEEVKRRILLGTYVLSADYYEAYYEKAQKVRSLIKNKTESILSEYDFILGPTCPTTAFKIGDKLIDPLEMYQADLLTVHASIVGNPAISLPNGNDSRGLPIGIQIMAKEFNETNLFSFGNYILHSN